MALPPGFNPNDMSFGNIAKKTPIIRIPHNTSTNTSWGNSCRESLWSRFNNGVANIGNWFVEKEEDILGWISLAAMILIIIAYLVKVITTWLDDGFWMALLMAIGLYFVGVIVWSVVAVVIVVVVNVAMYGFRLLFWNGWTLLIALALGIGGLTYSKYKSLSYNYKPAVKTEVYAPTYNKYRCSAVTLNVRIYPNKTSRIIGTLHKGQEVEVTDIEKGFAAIDYKGQRGYASLKYLTNKHMGEVINDFSW